MPAMAKSQRTLQHKQQSQIIIADYEIQGAYVTPTELHRATVASRCRWDEVRVCSAIYYSQDGQPPI